MPVWRVMFSQKSIIFPPFSLQEQVLRMRNRSLELEELPLIARQTSQEKEEEVSQQLLPCNDCKPVVLSGPVYMETKLSRKQDHTLQAEQILVNVHLRKTFIHLP